MQKTLILLLVIFSSCNKLPESIGLDNEIIILISDKDKSLIKNDIKVLFETVIKTPTDENIYNLSLIDPVKFSDFIEYKNIFVISLDNPSDSTIDIFNQRFFNNNNLESNNIISVDNLYSNTQKIISIKTENVKSFNLLLEDYGDWILNEFNENIDNNIYTRYNSNLLNIELSKIIKEKYNFDIFIDKSYMKINETNSFLWIGRGYPYRWIIFDIVDDSNYTDVWSFYTERIQKNINGLNISEYYRNEEIFDDGIILNGIYDYDVSDTGGPFFTYIFDKYIDNKLILVSGFVSNPGKDKYLLLKEIELIVKNIKGINNE